MKWAQAYALRCEVKVDWALGQEWGWCRHPRCPWWVVICRTPAHTQRRQRGPPRTTALMCRVKSSMIEWAEAVVWVVCEVGEEHKVFSVVLKRVVPLLQQEDEDGRVIHNKKKNFQNRKLNTRGRRHLLILCGLVFCHGYGGMRSARRWRWIQTVFNIIHTRVNPQRQPGDTRSTSHTAR